MVPTEYKDDCWNTIGIVKKFLNVLQLTLIIASVFWNVTVPSTGLKLEGASSKKIIDKFTFQKFILINKPAKDP